MCGRSRSQVYVVISQSHRFICNHLVICLPYIFVTIRCNIQGKWTSLGRVSSIFSGHSWRPRSIRLHPLVRELLTPRTITLSYEACRSYTIGGRTWLWRSQFFYKRLITVLFPSIGTKWYHAFSLHLFPTIAAFVHCCLRLTKNIFVAADQGRQNDELTKAFDSQFVCLREKELAKQQRLERLGLVDVFDEDSANMAASYGQMGQDAQAYLATLTPPSD